MHRSTIDKVVSSAGLLLAIVLLMASGGLLYAHNFIHNEVYEQLSAQKIEFPEAGSKAITSLPVADRVEVEKYAGQQLVNGQQAQVFANHYINAHLQASGGGRTYSELSTAARANPDDQDLTKKVDNAFRGETLRGMLLNAYAFDTMATIARIAAVVALSASVILVILSLLGFGHAKKVNQKKPARK